ncbi:cupin [Caulobacter sp. Root487D2Y]|uniref:cupin domain-containing protein n=1 Tax=Caulobacter sp. Root487D2Y TaxID=1736547 RepID=UPI0006FA3EF5|nr:cupin domain-containing protein [Caulobacter sp. Root487D2Y]KQY29447.1 cupin [Caulobacter sp. Root487D2Y]
MLSEISSDLSGNEIIRLLDLQPHPEGGWYRQTFKDMPAEEGRPSSTAIYYMLQAEERSAWHKIDAVEVWHYYAGAPLSLTLSPPDGQAAASHILGPDLRAGARPQIVVPTGWWQTAASLGAWTLVGCTVAPGFDFDGFELAPKDWRPHSQKPRRP